MTPQRMLERTPEREEQVAVTALPSAGQHYTSGNMEEDFSRSVDILMGVPRFLYFLQSADDEYNFLSAKARDELDDYIDQTEDYLGMFNEGE